MTMASRTKRVVLAALACLCCFCTVLLLFPVSLLPASADATPRYMLKMDLSKEADSTGERPFFASVAGLESGTYEFSFDYYSTATPAAGANIYSVSWENWQNAKAAGDHVTTGGVKTAAVRRNFTATADNGGRLTVGIDLHGQVTGGVIYAWNFKLVKEGDGTNLLPNPDLENGSLKNWCYSFKWFEQDAGVDPNGVCSAVEYDESLFGTPDDGKTYMLKMTNGRAGITYRLNVGTDIPEGTYVFTFDYFCDPNAAMVQADARFFGAGYSKAATRTLAPGRNTMSLEYTYDSGNVIAPGVLMPGVNGADGDPDIYMWNFKLTRKGDSDGKNYLSSFETGRFEGWRPGDQPAADAAASGQFTVMEYDASLFVDSGDEDDGKTYMLKMDMSKDAERTDEHPLFTSVTGLESGTYEFSFDYFSTATPAPGTNLYTVSWEVWVDAKMAGDHITAGAKSTAKVRRDFTATSANGGRLTMGIDLHGQVTGGVIYAWNFTLVKVGGDGTNLLPNPNFKNGSLKNWNYAYTGWYEQEAAADPNGVCSAVEYDESLFVSPGEEDDGKTYMLKMDLRKDADATTERPFFTSVTGLESGTYEFSFDYYSTALTGSGTNIYSVSWEFWQNAKMAGDHLATGAKKTAKVTREYTADESNGGRMTMGIDLHGQVLDGFIYAWNFKLVKVGGDGTNLLPNPNFKNGSLKNWNYAFSGWFGQDAAPDPKGVCSAIEYDESLFVTEDPDDGKTYMIKLPGAGNVLKADDYVEGTGNWIYFGQAFRVKMGDVYTFSYNYYTERTTTALARISPLTRMDQPVVQTLMAHYIEGKMVVTFRVGEQQGHGTYMGEMTEEQKQQAQYDAATDTVFLWFGITPGYYGDSYVWNLSLTKQGSDENLFDNPNFQRGGGTMAGWFLNGTNPGAVKKKLNFEVSELDRSIWKDKIIEVPEQEDPRDPNVNFTFERDNSQYDADHTVDPNPQNGSNGGWNNGGNSGQVGTGERTHTVAYAAVSAVSLVLVAVAVLYPKMKRKKQP